MAVKTNELPGTRAVLRHCRMSASKAREVLDLVRGMEYTRAAEILAHTDRGAAVVVAKLLRSAAANAEHNDLLDPTELYVASCYADEGTTLKRWRPRARGRATRIRKRSCHITIVLARMPENRLARQRSRTAANLADRRARRVAGTRRRDAGQETPENLSTAVEAEDVTQELGAGVLSDDVVNEESAGFAEPAESEETDEVVAEDAIDEPEHAVDEEPESMGDDGGEAV
jgi:large subunit ribosomal protein L22